MENCATPTLPNSNNMKVAFWVNKTQTWVRKLTSKSSDTIRVFVAYQIACATRAIPHLPSSQLSQSNAVQGHQCSNGSRREGLRQFKSEEEQECGYLLSGGCNVVECTLWWARVVILVVSLL